LPVAVTDVIGSTVVVSISLTFVRTKRDDAAFAPVGIPIPAPSIP